MKCAAAMGPCLPLAAAVLALAAFASEAPGASALEAGNGGFRGLPFGQGHALRGAMVTEEAEPPKTAPTPETDQEATSWMPYFATLPYLEGRLISLVQRVDLSVLVRGKHHQLEGSSRNLNLVQFAPAAGAPPAPQHPVLDDSGKVRSWNVILASVISTASSLLVWVVLVLAAAFFYRNSKDISEVDMETAKQTYEGKTFAHGPFDCFEDLDVCCWSFWCGSVQWADTMQAAGVFSFWVGLLIFMSFQFLNMLTGILVWFLGALLFAYFRQDLRRKFGLQNETPDMIKDVAMWCCCSCCAIAQEARHIKAARKLVAAS